jgi:hypothetical protein
VSGNERERERKRERERERGKSDDRSIGWLDRVP